MNSLCTLKNRSDFPRWLNEHGLVGEGAEIGCLNGCYSRELISAWHGNLLFMIDPWGQHDDAIYREPSIIRKRGAEIDFAACLKECQQLLSENPQRIGLMRLRSLDASGMVKDNSLDFAYIDADHSFPAALADAVAWYPKVKSGGVLGFHDATYNDAPESKEVKRALEEWNKFMQLPVHITPECGSAWFLKP